MERCRACCALLGIFALLPIASAADPPKKDSPKYAPAAAPPRDEVAVRVNGERIMLSELLARLDELGTPPDQREAVADDVLDALIDNALIVQFLASRKIPYDQKAVEDQIAKLRAEVEKEGIKFSEGLARVGLNEQTLRSHVIADVRWKAYLKQRVTNQDIADHVAKYHEFYDGTEVRASHILVEVPATANAAARAAAKAKAERIRKEVAAGLDFAAAARKYSDCPSKEQDGDVGFFLRRDKMAEPFARTAFALKVAETSGVVETEFGFHIIRVTERKPGTSPKLDDPKLRAQVMEAIGERIKESIVAQQRKTAKIEIAPDVPLPEPTKKTTPNPTASSESKKGAADKR